MNLVLIIINHELLLVNELLFLVIDFIHVAFLYGSRCKLVLEHGDDVLDLIDLLVE